MELRSRRTSAWNSDNESTTWRVRLTAVAEEDGVVVDVREEEQEAGQR